MLRLAKCNIYFYYLLIIHFFFDKIFEIIFDKPISDFLVLLWHFKCQKTDRPYGRKDYLSLGSGWRVSLSEKRQAKVTHLDF